MRSSVTHGDTESLSRTQTDVSAHLSWRFCDGQSKQVRGDNFYNFWIAEFVEGFCKVVKGTIDIWSLDHEAEEFSGIMFLEEFLVFSLNNLNVEISGFSLDDSLGR